MRNYDSPRLKQGKNQNRKKTAKRQKYNIYGSISVVKAKGNET